MRIIFTRHAENKIKDLKKLGISVTKSSLKNTLKNPIHVDIQSDYPRRIASAPFGAKHILRIVFREESDIITIITFYPAKKGRYF